MRALSAGESAGRVSGDAEGAGGAVERGELEDGAGGDAGVDGGVRESAGVRDRHPLPHRMAADPALDAIPYWLAGMVHIGNRWFICPQKISNFFGQTEIIVA